MIPVTPNLNPVAAWRGAPGSGCQRSTCQENECGRVAKNEKSPVTLLDSLFRLGSSCGFIRNSYFVPKRRELRGTGIDDIFPIVVLRMGRIWNSMGPLPLPTLWREILQALLVLSIAELLLRLLHELRRNTQGYARAQQAGALNPIPAWS